MKKDDPEIIPLTLSEVTEKLACVFQTYREHLQDPVFRFGHDTVRRLHTATVNLRPRPETDSDKLGVLFHDLESCLDLFLMTVEGGKAEIIMHKTQGRIYDQGRPYFSITHGALYEVYGFDSENHLYLRLTWEEPLKGPPDPRPASYDPSSIEREWISIDIDLIERSLWFAPDPPPPPENK